ncbi:MAG: hypothetical protein LBL65_05590 [Campylobacteraceae bacterium]|jgi:hypothetical protein|nr:hypothetical protein [Campylobacteraceae bacterium]
MVAVADVRKYHPLAGVEDTEIQAHLESALRNFTSSNFASAADYVEAVACQTIINVAPILWARGMTNFPGYETIYARYSDMDSFCEAWQKRLEGILERNDTTAKSKSGFAKWGAV